VIDYLANVVFILFILYYTNNYSPNFYVNTFNSLLYRRIENKSVAHHDIGTIMFQFYFTYFYIFDSILHIHHDLLLLIYKSECVCVCMFKINSLTS
jgi:hypothetical protein